jgi:hypothetical protein
MYVTTFSHAGVDGVSVVAYNPLGQASSPWLRLPVSGAHWQERKTPLLTPVFIVKFEYLPRQAWDKHGES